MLDWDLLAPVWEHFQNAGLDIPNLELFVSRLEGPSLLVGAGQGLVVPPLLQHAPPVLAIDISVAMARRAWLERRVRVVVADGAQLPIPEGSHRSAVINTGVLNAQQPELCLRLLRDLHRVLTPGGQALVNGFVAVGSWAKMGHELGFIEDQIQHNDRLLELWKSSRDPQGLVTKVAEWTGADFPTVLGRLQQHLQEVGGLAKFYDAVAADLEELGHEPVSYLDRAYAGPFPIFRVGQLVQLVQEAGFEIEDASRPEDSGSILILVCRKPS